MTICASELSWGLWIIGMVGAASVLYFIVWRRIAKMKENYKEYLRKKRCKHEQGVRETRSCDAICKQCGENLGFIGLWRKQHGIGGEE